jgi:hypothetical protein
MMKPLAFALCMVLASAAHAAVEVTVGDTDYSVDYFEGTYTGDVALLQEQVWWGDEALALDFATLSIESGLGYPNLDGAGTPLFAFAASDLKVNWAGAVGLLRLGTWSIVKHDRLVYYAVATAIPSVVPLPAAVWLFGSALLGLAVMKRKKA